MSDTSDIVPEDFDLDAARKADSTTPMHKRKCCPVCGSPSIYHKTPRPSFERENKGDYRCDRCGEHFNIPMRVGQFESMGGDSA